jgi:uncharacterized protein YdeI (YjbR/CyaY-like superfamily)
MTVTHFRTAAAFRRWLGKHHDTASEVIVGFYKKGTGKPSITYPEALDEALCFGWIDGVRRRIDDESYSQRFTPRRRNSIWSQVNIRKVTELQKAGRMTDAGLRAFEARDEKKSMRYSFENRPQRLPAGLEQRFKANKPAWSFFLAQPPGYRRLMIWYVMSAKKEETQIRRLERLVGFSERSERVPLLTSASKGRQIRGLDSEP